MLKLWSHPDLPRKTCYAVARRKQRLKKNKNQGFLNCFDACSNNSTHGKSVDQVPAQLLCQKVRNATTLHYLRKLCRVAKRIWKPELKSNKKKEC